MKHMQGSSSSGSRNDSRTRKDRVFGFTQTGEFITIDPRTGAGTLVRRFPAFPFWGAGVTTAITVID